MARHEGRNKTRRQRQRRRAGDVRRIEITLCADSERDHVINDYICDELDRGAVSEFIKQAISEKIARERNEQPEIQPASQQFNAILAELAELREAVSASASAPAPTVSSGIDMDAPRPPRQTPLAPTESPETSVSSGIDMSGPRRRKPRSTAPPTLPEQPEPEFDADAARVALLNSIMSFGRDTQSRRY